MRISLSRLVTACLLAFSPALLSAQPTALRGDFSVDVSGMANYSLPIEVPPGVNGMAPKLSLEFLGSGANGLLGLGWQLGGGGALTRCGATPAQDGRWGAVNFDAQDQLCLGGQRLMLVSGSHLADAAEYRFEVDDFTRVIARNGVAGLWFEVTNRQGVVSEYGRTSDARLTTAAGQAVSWGLSQVRDPRGNRIDWRYSGTAATGWFPSEVRYGYADSNASQPATIVRFGYQDARTDDASYYLSGARFSINRLLQSVAIEQGGQEAYRYVLQYATSPASGRSQLTTVTRQEPGGQSLLSPLTLQWNGLGGASVFNAAATPVSTGFGVQQGFATQGANPRFVEDVNGDGLPDVVGFAADGIWVALADRSAPSGSYKLAVTAVNSGGAIPGGWPLVQLVDINNDGLPDAVGFGTDGTFIALNNGDGKFAVPYRMLDSFGTGQEWPDQERAPRLFADVNGDGMLDLVGVNDRGVAVALNVGGGLALQPDIAPISAVLGFPGTQYEKTYCAPSSVFKTEPGYDTGREGNNHHPPVSYCLSSSKTRSAPQWPPVFNIQMQDLTGDGLPDLVGFAADGVYVASNTGNGRFNAPSRWTTGFAGWGGQFSYPRYLADVNRDGLPDIVGFKDQTWVALNTGRGFEVAQVWSSKFGSNDGWSYDAHPRFVEDMNGDGLPDVVGFAGDGVYVALNNGKQFDRFGKVFPGFGVSAGGWSGQNTYPRRVVDLNGDGLPDVIGFASSGTSAVLSKSGQDPSNTAGHADRLKRISSGDLHIGLRYGTLTEPSLYELDASPASFPMRSLSGPIPVLSSYSLEEGSQVQRYSYRYGGLRAELGSGRGVSGFAWISSKDEQSGQTDKKTYYQKWPLSGYLQQRELALANGMLLQKETRSYSTVALGSNRVFVERNGRTIQRNEVDGNSLPEITETTRYDCEVSLPCYGNPVYREQASGDGWVTGIETSFANNTSNWLLGLPLQVKETRSNEVTVTTPPIQPPLATLPPLAAVPLVQKYSAAGTYTVTVPTDKRYARVIFRLAGGGGGGGGGGWTSGAAAGGGGGAGPLTTYSYQLSAVTAPGFKLSLGKGGAGGAPGSGNYQTGARGAAGGASTLALNGVVIVTGSGGSGGGGATYRRTYIQKECGQNGHDCSYYDYFPVQGKGSAIGGKDGVAAGSSAVGGQGGSSLLAVGAGGAAAGRDGTGGGGGNATRNGTYGGAGGDGYAEVTFEPFAQ